MFRTNHLKKLLLVLFWALSGNGAFAQAAAYAATMFGGASIPYTPLGGTATPLSSGTTMDDATFAVSIAPFVFNGVVYTTVYVSENGYISFGTTDPGNSTRSFLSRSTTLDGGVSGFSGNLAGSLATSSLSWDTASGIGAPHLLTTTFQWKDMAAYAFPRTTNQNLNFQIKLDHYTSDITIEYGNMSATAGNSITGEVGISGATTSDFKNWTTTTDWSNPTTGINNSDAVTLSTTVFPPQGPLYLWVAPDCFAPLGLAATTVSAQDAVLEWTNPVGSHGGHGVFGSTGGGTPGNYDIVYGTGATMSDPANTSVSGVSSPYSISGLTPNTTYNFWVSSICMWPIGSTWVMTSFTTSSSSCTKPVVAVNGVSGGTVSICAGESLSLNATGAAGYVWSPATGLSCNTCANPTATPTAGTMYYVVGSNGVGCSDTDTVVMVVNPAPTVNAGPDVSTCGGSFSTQLNATGTGISTYFWSPSTGLSCTTCANPVAAPAGTTTYSLIATNTFGCSDTDFVVVTTMPAPMVMLGNDTTICDGQSLTLNAGNGGASYVWSTGSNAPSIVVTTAGSYSVAVIGANGCTGRDTLTVMVSPLPFVNLGRDTMLCMGDTFTLDAGNAGSSYAWSNGATTQTLDVTTPGAYAVSVTNTAGCVGMDAINVMPGMMPVAGTMTTTGGFPTYTFTVTGSQNDLIRGFSFSDGTVDTTGLSTTGGPTSSTHAFTANGTYTVRYYVANPCGRDSVMGTVTIVNAAVNTVALESEVTLAPNPASDRVMIRNTSAQAMKHITVLNAVGAVVRDTTPQNGKEQSIDLSGLAAATYMVRIEFDGGAIVVRSLQIAR